MLKRVVIVVPVYKEELLATEEISLQQVRRVLGHYPTVFVAPERMRDSFDLCGCDVEYFADEYFISTASYSELLLSPMFYERFGDYEYMLIYQLDAFVFRDELKYFCELGYDYIGAPWARWTKMYKYSGNVVGNGGLCLRHVRHTIAVLKNNEQFIKQFLPNLKFVGEDVLFAYFGANKRYGYSVAPPQIAKMFSLESDFQKSYANLNKMLPFGCHHWWNADFDIWSSFVNKQGFSLDASYPYIKTCVSTYRRLFNAIQYLIERIIRYESPDYVDKIIREIIPSNKTIVIWGNGEVARPFLHLFTILKNYTFIVFDKNAHNNKRIDGIHIAYPDYKVLKKKQCFVIVATEKFYSEIEQQLLQIGMIGQTDFLSYFYFGYNLVMRYYANFWSRYIGGTEP